MVPYDTPHADNPEAATGQAGTITARLRILCGGEESEMVIEPARTGILPGPVGVSFIDAQGIRWQRRSTGLLERRPQRLTGDLRVGLAVLWHGSDGR